MDEAAADSIAQDFAARYRHGPAASATPAQLDAAELAAATRLPGRYRRFLSTVGAFYTPKLLDTCCAAAERGLARPGYDIQYLFAAEKLARLTAEYQAAGMPADLIAIGEDCMGNLWSFARHPLASPRPADAPVLVFDHDRLTVQVAAAGWTELLAAFLALPPAPPHQPAPATNNRPRQLLLLDPGPNRLLVLAEIRAATGASLSAAKALLETPGACIAEGWQPRILELRERFAAAGAVTDLAPVAAS